MDLEAEEKGGKKENTGKKNKLSQIKSIPTRMVHFLRRYILMYLSFQVFCGSSGVPELLSSFFIVVVTN